MYNETPLVTEDLAAMFHVTTDTIVIWANHPKFPLPSFRVGRRYLFNRHDVDKWAAAGGIARMGDTDERMPASA